MTSWILPEKEKPPSVDSDFSNLVLTVYKLTRNDFHSSTADVIHPLYPQHLIFRFEGFRYALFFGKLFYQPRKQCFRLLMGFRAIGVAKSLPCAVRIKFLTTLFADTFGYLWPSFAAQRSTLVLALCAALLSRCRLFLCLAFFTASCSAFRTFN